MNNLLHSTLNLIDFIFKVTKTILNLSDAKVCTCIYMVCPLLSLAKMFLTYYVPRTCCKGYRKMDKPFIEPPPTPSIHRNQSLTI